MQNFDLNKQFNAIVKSATDAIKSVFPVVGKLRTITIEDIWVDDRADPSDFAGQAKVKNKEGTWGVPIYAKLSLVDNVTKKVIDQEPRLKLFNLPKVTSRFSYIVGGNEYQVQNQLRLKPGVYTLRKKNGELKTQVNLARGKNFDLSFDERDGTFYIQKVGGGQANIPLYPVLTYLGISHSAISSAWGSEVAEANKKTDPKALARAEAAFKVNKGELKEYFAQTAIDPGTTKTVLGEAFDAVSGKMLLSSAKNLLEVHKGKKDPVDRDSLIFKELHGIEDFISERISKNKNAIAGKIKRHIDNVRKVKIRHIVSPGSFSSTVESFFVQDDKSATPEQTNPLDMLSGQFKATVMGSGGISSDHAVTDNMREIHPTHYGFIDPIHTPESKNIGVSMNLPRGAFKDGKELKMLVIDKAGKQVTITNSEAFNKYVAFPGQTGAKVKALFKGQSVLVDRSKVNYFTPSAGALFSWSTNLIPFLPSNQGNRAMMASKQLEQAISLKNREVPLVQVAGEAGQTYEKMIGANSAAISPDDGVVKAITKDFIIIKTSRGEARVGLYDNFTLNRKSFLNHTPKVKVGERVRKGQLLADNNFTRDGVLSLGVNMRTAYLPYKGLNFEDGVVITDTAADKLTSEHIHKKSVSLGETTIAGLGAFRAMYPNTLTVDNMRKMGADGVIKKGEKVSQGEALVTLMQKRMIGGDISRISKALSDRPKDISVMWTLDDEGIVLDVIKTNKKIIVTVKTEERAKIGDKIAGRNGNKGIITKIIPDKEAPRNKAGQAIDIILNPHGVISRINIGQIFESAAGKAAEKNGKPYVVDNFSGVNNLEDTKKFLKSSKIDDKEDLYDPETGKKIGNVHVGKPYILKLYKQGTVNYSVRQGGPGQPYDANQQPLKAGGEEASKSLDLLTMYSLLSHGARINLNEMTSIKANQNDEFWKALKSGQQLPPPKSPFVYDKFMAYLKGAGIDVEKNGSKLTLTPLTDAQIKNMASGEVKKPVFYRGKNMEPVRGGFFDHAATGGIKGTKWSYMTLSEPTVNPVMESAVRKITGLGNKYDDIMDGKLFLGKDGTFNTEGKGLTGGLAVEKLLKGINVDSKIAQLEKKSVKAKEDALDDINKELKYLKALKETKLRPEEAYMRKVLPVVPPQFRPIYPLPDGNVTSSDVNYLYQNIGILNTMSNQSVMKLLPETEKAGLRKDMNLHLRGVSGLTDLNIKGRDREGFISELKGGMKGQPKEGFFISKMLSKKQDFVGRGTIIPEPDLGLDEMGMPEEMAWKLFDPFIVRELRNHGKNPNEASEEIKKKSPLAKKALDIVMRDKKVLLNRAPSLHKFSIMAFSPKIVSGRALKIPPLVVKGFNADFDGDTMSVHVPITDAANNEAKGMMPSANLFQPGTNRLMYIPSWEAQTGLFSMSKTPDGANKIKKIVGPKFKVPPIMDKKATTTLLEQMARGMPAQEFAKAVDALKKLGEAYTYDTGFTLGMSDVGALGKDRDRILAVVKKETAKAKNQGDLNRINEKSTDLINKVLDKKFSGKGNPLYDMVASGGRGDKSQLRSILATPLFVSDASGKVVATPIKKSYAEGLDIDDYWVSMYGARRGMMDRAIQTSEPGAFSKDIMAVTIDNVVSSDDCGTKEGIMLKASDPDAIDRYLAGDQAGFTHNTLVTADVVSKLNKAGTSIKVRSPLRCRQPKGTCARCHGLDERGELPSVGENIGAKAGQTISEPLVQMIMRTFHTGGVAGTGASAGGYDRVKQLVHIPKKLAGASALAPITGTITRIQPGLGGGFDIWVGDKKVHATQGTTLRVKKGDKVQAGDQLSTGAIRPQELVKLKGMEAAQDYLVDELQKTYQDQGQHIQKRVFETVVRSFGNSTKVMNNPKDSNFVPGDVASYTVVQDYNRNLEVTLPVDDAVGATLGESVAGLRKGHVLTNIDVRSLKAGGLKEVKTIKDPIVHAPFLKGITSVPMLRKDWMAQLGYRYHKKALTEGASQRWSTDVSGYHPVPAYAFGQDFGKGKDGKY